MNQILVKLARNLFMCDNCTEDVQHCWQLNQEDSLLVVKVSSTAQIFMVTNNQV